MPVQEIQFKAGPFVTRAWLWKGGDKGVLVLHEAFGMDDNVMSACEKLHSAGYTVFTFDFFGKDGPHPQAWGSERWTLERLLKPAYGDDFIHKRIASALEFMKQNGVSKAAFLGFGILGGTFATLYPAKFPGTAAAAAAVCGPVVREPGEWKFQPLSECRTLDCPSLWLFAQEDPWIPKRDFALLEANLKDSKKAYNLKVYENAKSGFSSGFYNPKSPHYDRKKAEDCWNEVKNFLQESLK